ncbi:MAG: tyrosine-type recombinase/integrase [Chloroflexi bacterium]|nr:tyrosine-type recombinase/integrase [Chloroflexota bacterium]
MAVLPSISASDGPVDASEDALRRAAAPQAALGWSTVAADGRSAESRDDTGKAQLATIVDGTARAEDYAGRSKSPATIKAYASGWRDFLQFCEQRDLNALPATDDSVAAYLAGLADGGAKAATIARRLVVISQAHRAADLPSPTTSSLVRRTHAGIRRSIGTAQLRKAPAKVDELKLMLGVVPDTRVGLRDRALLLLGFAGAFRRSELVSLEVSDLEFSQAGLIVTLRKSKTDQEGRSRRLGIPFGSTEKTCPVRAVKAWLDAARIGSGPVFRSLDRFQRVQPKRLSAERVALIVKRRAKQAGLDPARYAGHSLRAGLATSAAAGGASERTIMAQTGHRSADMVRRYIRQGNLWRDNAASLAGL